MATTNPGTSPGTADPIVVEPPRDTGGSSGAGSYRPQGEFSRGSLEGGYGAMGNAGVVTNAKVKAALDARYGGVGKVRTEAEKNRASGYLGFKRATK
jgi:hypothetical protein